uniref:ADAM metallopeptidase domain 21 n=1 Tax=Otolemur garnettii TaxID=30611 RepID=H0XID2_OTOGA
QTTRQLFQKSINFTLKQGDIHYGGWWLHAFFFELVMVVDHNRYVFRDNNATLAQEDVLIVLSDVSTFYLQLGLQITLTGIEVWTTENPITGDTIENLLTSFCSWKKGALNDRIVHDGAGLIVKVDESLGTHSAEFGRVCNNENNGVIVNFVDLNYTLLAMRLTYVLGKLLNVEDDNSEEFCVCRSGDRCLMNATIDVSVHFSNCSFFYFYRFTIKKPCLQNQPEIQISSVKTKQHCGNGLVEEGEQCDCGSWKLCYRDACCWANCTLRMGADCAHGDCCKNCQFIPQGTMCREGDDDCDLPEWCNGSSHACPDDVYKQNGSPCRVIGYCFENMCNTRDDQCKDIFGNETKNAENLCYTTVNTRGDRFGHCSVQGTTYTGCSLANSLCGRIQCQNVKRLPPMAEHTTIHWYYMKDIVCVGTDYHLGIISHDMGLVREGTECGEDLMCIGKECVPVSHFEQSCKEETCNLRGICNNRHHCHCTYDWDPPFCLKEGSGGSIDSGPPPQKVKRVKKVKHGFLIWIIIVLLILLLLILLLFLLRTHSYVQL